MSTPLPVALNPYLKPWITPLILSNDAYYIKIVVHYPWLTAINSDWHNFTHPANVKVLTRDCLGQIPKHPITFQIWDFLMICFRCIRGKMMSCVIRIISSSFSVPLWSVSMYKISFRCPATWEISCLSLPHITPDCLRLAHFSTVLPTPTDIKSQTDDYQFPQSAVQPP